LVNETSFIQEAESGPGTDLQIRSVESYNVKNLTDNERNFIDHAAIFCVAMANMFEELKRSQTNQPIEAANGEIAIEESFCLEPIVLEEPSTDDEAVERSFIEEALKFAIALKLFAEESEKLINFAIEEAKFPAESTPESRAELIQEIKDNQATIINQYILDNQDIMAKWNLSLSIFNFAFLREALSVVVSNVSTTLSNAASNAQGAASTIVAGATAGISNIASGVSTRAAAAFSYFWTPKN